MASSGGTRRERLVDGDEDEVPGHELDDGPQPVHRRADAEPGKPILADGRVDDAPGAELVEHPFADLIGPVVLGHLFPHQKDVLVAFHLLGHRRAERLAHLHLCHNGPWSVVSGPLFVLPGPLRDPQRTTD